MCAKGQEGRQEGVGRTLMASAGLTRPAVVGSWFTSTGAQREKKIP
jgi:hypothetical protein